jgi:hypothetical protein
MHFTSRLLVGLTTALATVAIAVPAHAADRPAPTRITVVQQTPEQREAALLAQLEAAWKAEAVEQGQQSIKITYGRSIYLNGWGWEFREVAAAFTAIGGAVILAGCVIQRVPARWIPYLRFVCSTVGLGNARWLLNRIAQSWNQRRFAPAGCYQLNLLYDHHVKRVRTKNCRR